MQTKREGSSNASQDVMADQNGHLRVADLETSVFDRSIATQIAGIGTGSAYADEDAVGLPTGIAVPEQGIIMGATTIDTDDNEINMNLLLFDGGITPTTDNSAFVIARKDYDRLIGPPILIETFTNISGDVIGSATNVNLPYRVPNGVLTCQVVTTGAPNFAAGTGLFVSLQIWTRRTMF